jgi:hypothetical protein
MATVLEGVLPKSSVVRIFCGQKDSMQRILIKKCLLFTVGSVCRVKRSHLRGKRFAWLRQQSKDFYAAGFDALVRRWDKCINVGGYVE